MAEINLLLNVATSLFRSGCGDDEALLESLGDTSGLRGSGKVLNELASRCRPDGGSPGAEITVAMVGSVESEPALVMFPWADDKPGLIDAERRSGEVRGAPRCISRRSGVGGSCDDTDISASFHRPRVLSWRSRGHGEKCERLRCMHLLGQLGPFELLFSQTALTAPGLAGKQQVTGDGSGSTVVG